MDKAAFRIELERALDDALAVRAKYLGWAVAGLLLSLGLVASFRSDLANDPGRIFVFLIPAFLACGFATISFSRHVRDIVMPVILPGVFGMSFRPKTHKPEIDLLVSLGLLPRGGWKVADAEAIGRVTGMLVRVWGVNSIRRAGRSRRSYSVYVCEFPAKAGWEGITLAPRRFYGWLFSTLPRHRFNTHVYRPVRRVGEIYSVGYRGEDVRISDLSRRIQATNALFQDWAAFAGAHFGKDRSLIVIQDNTLPLRMFGIFLTRDQILKRLSFVLEELSLPLRIADIWELDPERKAVSGAISIDAPAPPEVSAAARSTG